ncbi:MAG: hypothetical protein RLY93_20065 [Sumerlaeia bacterium]
MDTFPHGFLADLYCLTSLSGADFDRIEGPAGFHDTDPGEWLAPPAWLPALSGGEIESAQCFLGLDSFSGTTAGRIAKVNGPDLILRLQETALAFGQSVDVVSDLLQAVIDQSNRLKALAQNGVSVVRPSGSNARVLIPA